MQSGLKRFLILTAACVALLRLTTALAITAESSAPSGYNYVLADGWIYYNVETDQGDRLYKMRADGSGAQQLAQVGAFYLSVSGDMVYYIENEFLNLYRMKTDGSDNTLMCQEQCQTVVAAGDFVYVQYDEFGETRLGKLPRNMSLSEAGFIGPPEHVTNDPMDTSILIHDERIYYTFMNMVSGEDGEAYERCVYKMHTDGSGWEEILRIQTNCGVELLGIVDERLYYALHDVQSRLCSMGLDGKDHQTIAEILVLTYADGWVYYESEREMIDEPPEELEKELGLDLEPNITVEKGLYRMRLSGQDETKIATDAEYRGLTAVGDWLFFYNNELMPSMMRLDGAGVQTVPGYSEYIDPDAGKYEQSIPLQEFGVGSATVYVTSDDTMACYKLFMVEQDGTLTEALTCLLEPYARANMYVAPGVYVLKTAEGVEWISDEEAFGSSGHYTKTEPTELEAGYRYSIGTGPDGDFYGDDAKGFTNP